MGGAGRKARMLWTLNSHHTKNDSDVKNDIRRDFIWFKVQ